MAYMMGIDVGTTGTRAIIVRPDGHIVGAATGDHQPMKMLKPGWAEQEPEDWWHATLVAIRGALEQAQLKGSDIDAVGFSGQMHGVVLMDSTPAVLRPSLIWCDQRSQAQCDWITSTVGAERLIKLVSNPALTGFSAPKLLWVRDEEPKIFERAAHFLLPKDFVRFRLTGEFATDVSDASGTLLFDVTNRRWSREMLAGAGSGRKAPAARVRIGRNHGADHSRGCRAHRLERRNAGGGRRRRPGRERRGQRHRRAGAYLRHARHLGRDLCLYRSAQARPARAHPHLLPRRPRKVARDGSHAGRRTFPALVPRQLRSFGSWYARHTDADAYDLIINEARGVPPGSGGVLWLPYLMGERTPHLDAQARGMWFGLTAVHTRAHLIRSILEGVAFSLRDSIEIFRELKIPVAQIRSSGGGSRNFTWRQIQTDIFGTELVTLRTSEGSAFGAALLAGVAAKTYASVSEAAAEAIQVKESMAPLPENVKAYDRYYRVYRDLYPAVRDLAHTLANIG